MQEYSSSALSAIGHAVACLKRGVSKPKSLKLASVQ